MDDNFLRKILKAALETPKDRACDSSYLAGATDTSAENVARACEELQRRGYINGHFGHAYMRDPNFVVDGITKSGATFLMEKV